MNIYDNEKKLVSIVNNKICKVFILKKNNNGFEITVEKFDGVKTIKKINLKSALNLKIKILCTEGKMKLIAIKDKKIIVLAENQNADVELLNGVYRLRLVGANASGKCIITKI